MQLAALLLDVTVMTVPRLGAAVTTRPIEPHALPAGRRVFSHLLHYGVTVHDLALTGNEPWLPEGAHATLERHLDDLGYFLNGADDRAVGAWLRRHAGPVDQRERLAAVSIAHQPRQRTPVGIKARLAPLDAPKKRTLLPIELAAVRIASKQADAKATLIGAIEAQLAQAEIALLLSCDVADQGLSVHSAGTDRTRERDVPFPEWARRHLVACSKDRFGLLYNGSRSDLKKQTASIGMNLKGVLQAAGVGFDPTVSGQSVANTILVPLVEHKGIDHALALLGRRNPKALRKRLRECRWGMA